MLLGSLSLEIARGDRWLLAFSIAAIAVLLVSAPVRATARERARHRRAPNPSPSTTAADTRRGTRRRAGALMALGPLIGLAVAPDAGDHAVVIAATAVALAVLGVVVERHRDAPRTPALAALAAAVVAVAAGVRFEPTGVEFFDIVGAVAFIAVVTLAVDGLGNADGLVAGLGVLSGSAIVALAAFGDQLGVANVAAGLVGAAGGFLAFNLHPASLFAGRGGRLAVGYTLAVTALTVTPTTPSPGRLFIAPLIVAVPLLDAWIVGFERLRRRRRLLEPRRDHVTHRIRAAGASSVEMVTLLLGTAAICAVLAIFAGRHVLSMWIAAPAGLLLLGTVGGFALHTPLERMRPIGFGPRAVAGFFAFAALVALAIVPTALAVPDVTSTMQDGRHAATRGLSAARDGDVDTAQIEFRRAAAHFADAADQLDSTLLDPALAVPGLAPNLHAARALATIGRDLARAGTDVTGDVDPSALAIDNGRVPLEEVARVVPSLERGARVLARSVVKIREVAVQPYLVGPVRDAIHKVRRALERAAGEARRTAAAARLAPKLLGSDGTRHYLVVMQNNAEARPTGGLIGSYGILSVTDGTLTMGPVFRTGDWNAALKQSGLTTLDAPSDYRARYGIFDPLHTLQSVNLSPDFPTVARILETLAPVAGVGEVDGVMAVDPQGLAALLDLTGSVRVAGWPTDIDSSNVVDVTLRDAYAAFAATPERAEFLGDVAQAVVGQATHSRLGEPAEVAKVLGRSAHEGHILLAMKRPVEQDLVRELDIAGAAARSRGDLLAVTNSNAGGNKLDYYLHRDIRYQVKLTPTDKGRRTRVRAKLRITFENQAPTTGLPQIVAGPYEGFPTLTVPGENRTWVAIYSPLRATTATLNGEPVNLEDDKELGVRVYSGFVRIKAGASATLVLELEGELRLDDRTYRLALGRQPLLGPDRVQVLVSAPAGWHLDGRGPLRSLGEGKVVAEIDQLRPRSLRARLLGAGDSLWDRLQAGR